MRRMMGIAIVALALAAGLYAAWRLIGREPPRPEGPLVAALRAAHQPGDRGQNLKPVFDRFVAEDAPLEARRSTLVANGFDCTLRPEAEKGASLLACRRPFPGTGGCEGFFYYSYRTAAGRTVLTVGTTYRSRPRGDLLGRCTHLDTDPDAGRTAETEDDAS